MNEERLKKLVQDSKISTSDGFTERLLRKLPPPATVSTRVKFPFLWVATMGTLLLGTAVLIFQHLPEGPLSVFPKRIFQIGTVLFLLFSIRKGHRLFRMGKGYR